MADSKISGLAAVAAFAGTQEFPVNDSGTSKKISGTQLIAAVAQGTLASGYAQVTANQGTFTAETDITGLTITVTVATGRRIRISGQLLLQTSVAGDTAVMHIFEGATQLQSVNMTLGTANQPGAACGAVILTPSSGAHTYKISCARASGTGNITMIAATTYPAFILAEDIGV